MYQIEEEKYKPSTIEEQINKMSLHETIDIETGWPDYMTKVTRVIGGLNYEKVSYVTGKIFSTSFVPYTEFIN